MYAWSVGHPLKNSISLLSLICLLSSLTVSPVVNFYNLKLYISFDCKSFLTFCCKGQIVVWLLTTSEQVARVAHLYLHRCSYIFSSSVCFFMSLTLLHIRILDNYHTVFVHMERLDIELCHNLNSSLSLFILN